MNINGYTVPLAKIVVDSVFTAPCKSSILYPTAGGNIHCFTAITPCVFLDVLGPSFLDGRDCSYYKEHPSSSSSSSSMHFSTYCSFGN